MIHNYTVNYDDTQEIPNIEHDIIESVGIMFSKKIKMQFYNPLINEPLVKYTYFIKNAKIIKHYNNKIHIVISSSDKKLITSIKNLDIITNTILQEYGYKPSFSTIERKFYPLEMEIIIDNKSIIYDKNNNKQTCIEEYKTVMLYIEFDYAIINNITSTKRWTLLQMKETEPIVNLSVNMFVEQVKPIQHIPCPPNNIPICPPIIIPCPPQIKVTQHTANTPPKPTSLMFDFNELLSKRNKLKKRTKETEHKINVTEKEIFIDKLVSQKQNLKKSDNVGNDTKKIDNIANDIQKLLDTHIQLTNEYNQAIQSDILLLDTYNKYFDESE
jgi:hypothetical protein